MKIEKLQHHINRSNLTDSKIIIDKEQSSCCIHDHLLCTFFALQYLGLQYNYHNEVPQPKREIGKEKTDMKNLIYIKQKEHGKTFSEDHVVLH